MMLGGKDCKLISGRFKTSRDSGKDVGAPRRERCQMSQSWEVCVPFNKVKPLRCCAESCGQVESIATRIPEPNTLSFCTLENILQPSDIVY